MNTLGKTLVSLGVLVLPLIAIGAPVAQARAVGAWGSAQISGPTGCVRENFGAVLNGCSSSIVWEVALPIDSFSSFSPTVDTGANDSCETFSVSQTGMLFQNTANVSAPPRRRLVYAWYGLGPGERLPLRSLHDPARDGTHASHLVIP